MFLTSHTFHTYFLPRDFFIRLADQIRQRKQGYSESFKDYMIDEATQLLTERPLPPSLYPLCLAIQWMTLAYA